MQSTQPQVILFDVAIYYLVACRLGHVLYCFVGSHMLHIGFACCGRSVVATAALNYPFLRQLVHERLLLLLIEHPL
jgi:hypothetical protein